MDELIKEMQKIGFTNYDARIYIALLQNNPATGYEISKFSGVPQAKVYENIARLTDLGIVVAVGSEPSKYIPLPPEELLKTVQNNFEKSINILHQELPALCHKQKTEYVWNIKGYDLIMSKAVQMIHEAKDELMISLWDEEASQLGNELIDAVNRGVLLNILLYGKLKIKGIQKIHYHGMEEKVKQIAGGRWLTIVADKKEVISGRLDKESDEIAIWTKNQNVVFLSSRSIEHEIYISNKLDQH